MPILLSFLQHLIFREKVLTHGRGGEKEETYEKGGGEKGLLGSVLSLS